MHDSIIRKIEPKDNAAIAAVIRSVFIELNAPVTGTAYADPTLDDLYMVYKQPRSVYYVVEQEGNIVGGAGIGPLENGDPTVCELQKMYFLPQLRGLGIGSKLIAKCLEAARDYGYAKCYLETLTEMKAAQKLYVKSGFKYLGSPLGNTGHSSCPVWMIKDLAAPQLLLKGYKDRFVEKLTPLYDAEEAESFFYITLEELKGWRRIDFIMDTNAVLTAEEIAQWNAVVQQLERQKPIQYIFRKAHFYGLEFEVNEHTLIPRPETEELVEWIINDTKNKGAVKILDIGTGSGCIAISLAKNLPEAQVFAIDISEYALVVAKRNAANNNADVTFIQKDILGATELPGQFDIIVSNPPYVRNLEKAEIKPNVLDYEPHLALFVNDNDPLIFYRKIAELAATSLTKGGKLYYEINQYLGHETVQMLKDFGYKDIILRKDMQGNDRMILSTIKPNTD